MSTKPRKIEGLDPRRKRFIDTNLDSAKDSVKKHGMICIRDWMCFAFWAGWQARVNFDRSKRRTAK